MPTRHAKHDPLGANGSFRSLIERHWPWFAGFITAVGVLQYQVMIHSDELDALKPIVTNVTRDHQLLRNDFDHFTKQTTEGAKETRAGIDRLAATMGSIRDWILSSGILAANSRPVDAQQPLTQPIAPRRP